MKTRIALFMRASVPLGGAQKSMLTLAEVFASRGYEVDVVIMCPKGDRPPLPPAVTGVFLDPAPALVGRWAAFAATGHSPAAILPILLARRAAPELTYLPALISYLISARPTVLLSALSYANLLAVW